MPLGVGSHGILLGSHRILLNRSSIQCPQANRLERAVQKQHWCGILWDPVGSSWDPTHMPMQEAVMQYRCPWVWDPMGSYWDLGSHTALESRTGSRTEALGVGSCGIPWDPAGIPHCTHMVKQDFTVDSVGLSVFWLRSVGLSVCRSVGL